MNQDGAFSDDCQQPNVFTPVLGSDWAPSLRAPDAHQQEEQHPCCAQLHHVLGSVPHPGWNHRRAPAGVCRSWAADERKKEEEQGLILELPCARSVPRRFSSLLCGITTSPPLTELGGPTPSLQLWLPGSAQLAEVHGGTWKANPAEHADCRQSPRNSAEKRWHVQSKNFQKENWLSFGRSSYKIKTLPLCQRSPADKFKVHVPVQRCATIFQRDRHKKGTIILLRFLKTDEEFWLNALNKLKPKAKKRHRAFQSKRLQLSNVINNRTQHLLKKTVQGFLLSMETGAGGSTPVGPMTHVGAPVLAHLATRCAAGDHSCATKPSTSAMQSHGCPSRPAGLQAGGEHPGAVTFLYL